VLRQPLISTWVDAKSGHENIYFTVNSTGSTNIKKKPTKNEIIGASWLHVDVDPSSDDPALTSFRTGRWP
jgi:hypothetical protein